MESVISVKSIKYIYKYIYKGHDRTTMGFGKAQDEVALYLNARYISSCESVWRLMQFPMHQEKPNVIALQIHLPDHQLITFNPNLPAQEILQHANSKHTTLTAWFELNKTDPSARQYLYQDIPHHYTWDKKSCSWKRRKRGDAVGRMYFASPTQGERFFLRLLLTVRRGM